MMPSRAQAAARSAEVHCVPCRSGRSRCPVARPEYGPRSVVRRLWVGRQGSRLAALLLGARQPEPGRVPAVRLTGAVITGVLDLSFADVPYAATLRGCEFAETPDLYGSRLHQLNLSGSRMPGLEASDARIDGLLWLRDCRFDGPVRLVGCRVEGTLSLRGARLGHRAEVDSLSVTRNVDASGLVADAEILMRGARIDGTLTLDGARLTAPAGTALNADGITVGNGILAGDGLEVHGTVRLPGARIGQQLRLPGARLTAPGGTALDLDRARVDGAVEIGRGLRAEGRINLRSAVVAGTLDSGSSCHGPRHA